MFQICGIHYTPEIVFDYCYRCLVAINKQDDKHRLKFIRPTIWLSLFEHHPTTCYFCQSKPRTFGHRYETREMINYYDSDSVITTQIRDELHPYAPSEEPHQEEEAMTDVEFDANVDASHTYTSTSTEPSTSTTSAATSEFIPPRQFAPIIKKKPHFITQSDFNDLVRDSRMSQNGAELWASRLQQWNLVAPDSKVTANRKRAHASDFDECFSIHEESNIAYCNNITDPNDWRLFIDASVQSLKAVLLHIGNIFPSVPIAYSTSSSENYETMQLILQLIQYDVYAWRICCDLKVVAILTGIKRGFSKHQCFLCHWEGHQYKLHYTNHKWDSRGNYRIGTFPSIVHLYINLIYCKNLTIIFGI